MGLFDGWSLPNIQLPSVDDVVSSAMGIFNGAINTVTSTVGNWVGSFLNGIKSGLFGILLAIPKAVFGKVYEMVSGLFR